MLNWGKSRNFRYSFDLTGISLEKLSKLDEDAQIEAIENPDNWSWVLEGYRIGPAPKHSQAF